MSPAVRYHHLDALRAFAMLLGIVLHALLSFVELPVWPAQDIHQHHAYGFVQHAIHGFRMPLFFLISGFFTTMLWRRRGLKKLVHHRFLRIFLPLVAAWFVFVPMLFAIGFAGGIAKEAARKNAEKSTNDLWSAARQGDPDLLATRLEEGADVNARDGAGLAPLAWAALMGHAEAAATLLKHRADLEVRDNNQATPLHSAAFLGHLEVVQLLVEQGADLNARANDGNTPLDSAQSDWATVEFIAALLQIEVDRVEVEAGRAAVIAFLEDHGAKRGAELTGTPRWLALLTGIYQLFAMIPVFHHLWFLYYLLWLVAGFVVVAWLVSRRERKPLPRWLLASPTCWLWLVPLTILPQFFMRQSFGPDTAAGILPWPPKLFYYALFFGFGALCFGRSEFEEKAGRWWPLCFAFSLAALVPGLHFFEAGDSPLLTSICAALYAWLMIYGCLGFFRRFCANPNKRIRYLSDASYWLYLAHLPLVMALQILVMTWSLPSFVKFLAICLLTYALLLVVYEYAIRYTPVGTLLNGRKVRLPPLPPQ